MNKIELHGMLADKYGKTFELDVRDPAEAYRALDTQLPQFRADIIAGGYTMVRELSNGELAVTEELLFIGMSHTTVHFMPTMEGAANGKGIGKTLLGIGLIAGSFFIPGSTGLIAGLTLKSATLAVGLAMGFAGVATLLAPTPKIGDDNDKFESFLFQGDTSTGAQNLAIPAHFGRTRAKLIPVSTEIRVNQIGINAGGTYSNPATGVGSGGGYTDQERDGYYNSNTLNGSY